MAQAALVRGAIDVTTSHAWLAAIDAHPAWQRRQSAAHGGEFNVHSSSLRVAALGSADAIELARAILRGAAGTLARSRLGDAIACDVDQCWVRRQYAPSRYPPGHAPHAWHQDGALGFDFLDATSPPGAAALLPMLTCWVALTPCGRDAPGLELVTEEAQTLLPLAALDDSAIRSAHGVDEFWRPVLGPGDCLAFGGGVLHHTHVSPAMRMDRTSVELRFFDAKRIDPRLHRDRFVALH